MASQAVLEGHYVTHRASSWDAFTDNQGRQVAAGRSLKVWIMTPHDNDLCEVRIAADSIDTVRPVLEQCTFGVLVKAQCGDKAYGAYKGFAVERAEKPARAA